jgi:uncharacterized protein
MQEHTMAPIQTGERINEIDIVRGLALFGILMVNMSFFKYPVFFDRYPSSFPEGIDQLSAWFIQLFFTGNFYAIFSFLFGLGFFIFMERTLEKGLELVPLYRRRLLALFVFGLLHLLLFWSGDILMTYAIVGFILLKFRRKSLASLGKWIIGLFITSLILNVLFGLVGGLGEVMAGDKYVVIMTEMIDEAIIVYLQGSFWQLVAFRALNELPYVLLSLLIWIPAVLAFFLCGFYVGKKGVFKDIPGHLVLLRKIISRGLPLGIFFLLLYLLVETGIWPVSLLVRPALLAAFNYLASIFIFPSYIAIILLVLQGPFCKKLLTPLAAAGRMALTNYLMQTLLSVFVFYGFGLGLYGAVTVTVGILLTIGIYVIQVIWSNLWLRKFLYGPMEWFWRVLTYKQLQPFVISDSRKSDKEMIS